MLVPPVQRASPGSPHADDLESSASPKTVESESLAPPLLQRACTSCEQEKQAPRWQAKYAVHPPGDRWEQEADRTAEAVTRGSPAPRLTEVSSGGLASGIQRRSRPSPTPSPRARHPAVRPDPVAQVLRQPASGTPLHPPSRRHIESTLGADLTHVRVHTGPAAEEATESIQARAFTHGRDIWIGRGESPTDPELLAHEAAHVVQQRAAPAAPTPPPAPTQPSAPATPLQTTPQPAASTAAPASSPQTPGSGAATAPAASSPAGAPAAAPASATTPAAAPGASNTGPAGPSPASGASGQARANADVAAPAPAAAPSAGAPAAEAGIELRIPPPPDGLSETDQARLGQAQEAAAETAVAQQSLPGADASVGEARGAVQEPAVETTARASGALAEALGRQPAPSPEIEELCERIRTVIRERRPPDEESLLQSDPQAAAQAAGGQLQSSVQSDAKRVQSGYDTLNQPAEGSPQQQPQPLPGTPAAEAGAPIEATRAVPDAVPAENVSLDADVEASQSRMDEAGMSSEPAQLVESGPIAEAREAQGELSAAAERDPAEVLAEQTASRAQASADMAALQQQALEALHGARAETVAGTSGQQTSMVGSEEQMRAQVSAQAQQLFDSAQSRVNALLEPLPTTAMRRWETGVQVLSTRFEQDLARLEEWKRERYSGVGGALLELWEGVVGMPDWVIEEYDRAESNFGDGVCSLIREISTEVDGVVATCEQIIDDARTQISELFAGLPAELQEWAAGEQARFTERLDGLQQRASAARDDFNRNLAERAAQSVQEVRQRIHELRQAAGGLLGRIADAVNRFLDDPARFILEGLLQLVGIPPASFWAVVDKIGQVIDDLADDPMGFANNLVAALGQGFQRFFDNFADHIVGGLFDWLFSGLGSVGVEIPQDFSLRSLITFFLQLMGITWPRIRELLARHIGEENVALLERAYEIIATLIEQGPSGIFEMIKDQLNPQTILDQVIQAAIDFLMEALVTQVAARIIALFNPAGAIIQAIEIIYRVLRWIFENAARIFALIETVVNGIADLIAGNIGGMAAAVEGALARLIAPVIDFLAGFLGLGNLPDRIADTIRGFQEWVLGILDRVIGWLAQRARSLLRALGLGGEEDQDEVHEDDPEKANRVREGLAAIDTEEHRVVEGGRLSREEAVSVAAHVRRDHPVFTRLEVVDGNDSWDYHWEASPGDTKEGKPKEEAAGPHAANWDAVQSLIGQPMGTPLPEGYRYRSQNGREFPQRIEADDALFEQLGLDAENRIKLGASEEVERHPSRFVMEGKDDGQWKLMPEYRGSRNIRPRFYNSGSGYTSAAETQRDAIVEANTDPHNNANWVHPEFTLNRSVPKSDVTIDHDPPVAEHWNTDGNASIQSDRSRWYSFEGRAGDVVALSRAANSAQGSGGIFYTENVTITFRGPGE